MADETVLYIHYDKDHADNDAYVGDTTDAVVHNVWDANFKLVMHMAQDPNGDVADAIKDSTSNGNDGTPSGSMTTADLIDAEIGKGIEFDGTDDLIAANSAAVGFFTEPLTMSCIVKAGVWDDEDFALSGGQAEVAPDQYCAIAKDASRFYCLTKGSEGNENKVSSISTYSDNDWHDLDLTVDTDGHILSLGVDGADQGGDSTYTASMTALNEFFIGQLAYKTTPNVGCWTGGIDEVRLSNTVRSDAWRKATHYSNFDDLVTFGSEEASFLPGWDNCIKITIDGSKIDSTLSDFPLLVHLSTASGITSADVSAVFDELQSDDNRKKFAITSGDVECYSEIERWDDANEEAWLWVKVPEVTVDYGIVVPVSFSGTLQRTIEVSADLSIPISLPVTIRVPLNIDAALSIPVSFSATVGIPIIQANLAIPISLSGTMIAPEVLNASLSIPISLSGTMNEIEHVLNAGLAIPISFGGTVEVNPIYDLVLVKDIPALQLTAEAYDSSVGVFVQDIPSLEITASGYASIIANALVTLPRLTISAEGSSTIIGNLSRTLPRLELSGTGLLGSVGTLSVSLPSLRISSTSYSSVIGTAEITLPSLILSTSMVPLEYLTMVMNLKNQALTEFTNYEFNSMCHYKGLNLGATKTGIHLLDTGDTDNETAIDWNFRTGLLDLHMKTKKKLRQAWLSCKINGNLTVTVVEASGDEYEYDAESYEITEDGVRVKFGRGLNSRYLALDVKNDEEATLVLDSIRLNLDRTEKRR